MCARIICVFKSRWGAQWQWKDMDAAMASLRKCAALAVNAPARYKHAGPLGKWPEPLAHRRRLAWAGDRLQARHEKMDTRAVLRLGGLVPLPLGHGGTRRPFTVRVLLPFAYLQYRVLVLQHVYLPVARDPGPWQKAIAAAFVRRWWGSLLVVMRVDAEAVRASPRQSIASWNPMHRGVSLDRAHVLLRRLAVVSTSTYAQIVPLPYGAQAKIWKESDRFFAAEYAGQNVRADSP